MPIDTLPRRPSSNLARDLESELTQRIVQGKLRPGNKLPSENAFVHEFGVSRTVVREAISKLQASGLVETFHGRGTYVIHSSPRPGLRLSMDTMVGMRDILELRMGLETQAAALAARRRSEDQVQQMREALEEHRRLAGAGDSCVEPDRRFHLLVAEATGNSYFTEILSHLGQSLIPRNRIRAEERGDSDLSSQAYIATLEHDAILAAIARKDPDGARAAMWLHLINSRERMVPGPSDS